VRRMASARVFVVAALAAVVSALPDRSPDAHELQAHDLSTPSCPADGVPSNFDSSSDYAGVFDGVCCPSVCSNCGGKNCGGFSSNSQYDCCLWRIFRGDTPEASDGSNGPTACATDGALPCVHDKRPIYCPAGHASISTLTCETATPSCTGSTCKVYQLLDGTTLTTASTGCLTRMTLAQRTTKAGRDVFTGCLKVNEVDMPVPPPPLQPPSPPLQPPSCSDSDRGDIQSCLKECMPGKIYTPPGVGNTWPGPGQHLSYNWRRCSEWSSNAQTKCKWSNVLHHKGVGDDVLAKYGCHDLSYG